MLLVVVFKSLPWPGRSRERHGSLGILFGGGISGADRIMANIKMLSGD
jgi:hypothetical protein